MQQTSIQQTLKRAQTALAAVSDEFALEASLLMQHVLNVNRAWLIAHENDALEATQNAVFEALLQRRLQCEPIAYILSCREFYSLNLKVTPDTLIPRPDTEALVDAAIERIPVEDPNRAVDLGTGSGAIALAIAKHRPNLQVTAVDASQAALDVAIENAKTLQITNVSFKRSDWFSNLQGEKFDLIVSNPPYIAKGDVHLTQGDLPWEPISALASGDDGLDAIRHIVAYAPQYLTQRGWLLLEHGFDQSGEVAGLMQKAGFVEIGHAHDLAGIVRVTLGMMME